MTAVISNNANAVLMVRPAVFLSNPETAATNEFQKKITLGSAQVLQLALVEFDGVVTHLRAAGVEVFVVDDTATPVTPDAVFPNNWFTTDRDGQCILYPMQPESRRAERRPDIIRQLSGQFGCAVRRIVDWSDFEHRGMYLEGTGSLVLDHVHRSAYACLSARTDKRLLEFFCAQHGYAAVDFSAAGPSGQAIYHTNVMMCMGTEFAVVCAAAISDGAERQRVLEKLAEHREVVVISMHQMTQFAGNMLELRDAKNATLLVMSQRARDSLDDGQRRTLERYARIVACDVSNIEDASGGSVRCMLAEIYLPRR